MEFKSTEINEIWECINHQPHKYIRLSKGKTQISNFNQNGKSREDHFEENIKPFLLSKTTPEGKYQIEGKNSGKAVPYTMVEIIKGEPEDEKPKMVSENPQTTKINANISLIEENAELRYKVVYLEKEILNLKNEIKNLETELSLFETAAAEEEEEEEKPKTLSEGQALMLNLAGPLIPLLQESAIKLLSKYLNVEPKPENNEPGAAS